MPSSSNPTLDRLSRPVGGFVYNPFFEGIGQANTVTPRDAIEWGEIRYNGPELLRAAGWYTFGQWPQVQMLAPDNTMNTDNPFIGANSSGRQRTGIKIRVNGPNDPEGGKAGEYPSGICQRLRRGDILLGKKIRISGSYIVRDGDTASLPIGVSVWLKANVKSMDVSPDTLTGSAGDTTAAGSVMTDLGGNFVVNGVAAGDVLVVSGQTLVEEFPAWKITARTATTVTVSGTFPSTGTGLTWGIAKQSDGEASFAGRAAIRLGDGTSNRVGHVIRWTGDGETYSTGEEWLIRAFDSLVTPYQGGGTLNFPALFFKKYHEDKSVIAGNDNYLAVAPPPDGSKIFYLDQDVWDNVPATGNQELVTHTSTSVDVVQYFEEEVDVSALLNSTNGDIWVCIFAAHPNDVDDIDTFVSIGLYALNIELVPGAGGGSGVQDRLLRDFVTGLGSGHPDSAFLSYDLRHYAQYPVYIPCLYPLNVNGRNEEEYESGGGTLSLDATVYNFKDNPPPTSAPFMVESLYIGGVAGLATVAEQAQLPPFSCIVEASFWLISAVDISTTEFYLTQIFSKPPKSSVAEDQSQDIARWAWDSAEPNKARGYTSAEELRLRPNNSPTWGTAGYTDFLKRNRIGLYPGGGANNPDTYAKQGAAQLIFRIDFPSISVPTTELSVANGYIMVAVDPRVHHGLWSTL